MIKILNVIDLLISLMWFGTIFLFMFCIPKAIHIFQQESYHFKDYFRWIYKNPKKAFGTGIKEVCVTFLYSILMILLDIVLIKCRITEYSRAIIYMIQLLMLYIVFYSVTLKLIVKWRKERAQAKKKLVYTGRVKRLLFFIFIGTFLVSTSFTYTGTGLPALETNILMYACTVWKYSIFILTMPVLVILGAFLAYPLESIINDYYISSARWKIIRPKYSKLIRIGITGSYGKTSMKFILKTILSEKYNVLATPESYNTTMGNVKIIRKELKPEHEIFISEMGARYKGDIRKICDFVYPQIGIITSIGPQHLETFKTIEGVAATKGELLNALPSKSNQRMETMYSQLFNKNTSGDNVHSRLNNGAIFLPSDGSFCSKLYENEKERNKFSYSLDDKNSKYYAKNIKLSDKGCEFIAHTPNGEIKCTTQLLGKHNIQNIMGAIAIAEYLGLSHNEIARGVEKIEPVEHRLQLVPTNNGSTIIDDAFNSNPAGSKAALDVLKEFKGRKIIVTPGMVELGDEEYKYNKEFGEYMADCVDVAILVGVKRSEPIEKGLLENGFNKMNIYVVDDLKGATNKLGEIGAFGDVVLFENDLPDNYNE